MHAPFTSSRHHLYILCTHSSRRCLRCHGRGHYLGTLLHWASLWEAAQHWSFRACNWVMLAAAGRFLLRLLMILVEPDSCFVGCFLLLMMTLWLYASEVKWSICVSSLMSNARSLSQATTFSDVSWHMAMISTLWSLEHLPGVHECIL